MKKVLVAFVSILILAGCSKNSQFTSDLTGTWTVYKVTYFNVPAIDSFTHYSITFTSGGQYMSQDTLGAGDTLMSTGKWQFQNSYSQLVLTDTSNVQNVYTIFNLTGNSVELLQNGYDRYMRKNP